MKLSIITVNYNNRDGLEKTVLSVIGQKGFDDYEYIIIDGGSSDGSRDVIEKYASRIDYWVSESDSGIYNAMNKGIRVAKGEYCIFMNSGDCLYDEKTLMKVCGFLNKGADFVAGNYEYGNKVGCSPVELTAMFMFRAALCHQSTFINREMFASGREYDESFIITADWVHMFDALVLKSAKYQYVDIVISRLEENGISKCNWKQLEQERRRYLRQVIPKRIIEDYELFCYAKALDGTNQDLFRILSKHHFVKNELVFVNFLLKIIQRIKKLSHRLC